MHWVVPHAVMAGQVCTFVGTHAAYLQAADRGLFLVLFLQSLEHGNVLIRDEVDLHKKGYTAMRIIRPSQSLEIDVATAMAADGFALVQLSGDPHEQIALQRLWAKDVGSLGGLPAGLPNSSRQGLYRSHGLPFGAFACAIRSNAMRERVFRCTLKTLGRHVTPNTRLINTFDALTVSRPGSHWTGIKGHADIDLKNGETGHLNSICVCHPPPPGYTRLGVGGTMHVVTPFTWRNGAISTLTKWSSSPSTYPRTPPTVSLGADRRSMDAPILGGKVFDKCSLDTWSDNALDNAVRTLPRDLAALIPPRRSAPTVDVSSLLRRYLEKEGLSEIRDLKKLHRARANGAPRKLALQGLCGGLGKEPMRSILAAETVHEAALVCAQMERFGAPDKVAAWVRRAEIRRGAQRAIPVLKPCGHTKRKWVGVRL